MIVISVRKHHVIYVIAGIVLVDVVDDSVSRAGAPPIDHVEEIAVSLVAIADNDCVAGAFAHWQEIDLIVHLLLLTRFWASRPLGRNNMCAAFERAYWAASYLFPYVSNLIRLGCEASGLGRHERPKMPQLQSFASAGPEDRLPCIAETRPGEAKDGSGSIA